MHLYDQIKFKLIQQNPIFWFRKLIQPSLAVFDTKNESNKVQKQCQIDRFQAEFFRAEHKKYNCINNDI